MHDAKQNEQPIIVSHDKEEVNMEQLNAIENLNPAIIGGLSAEVRQAHDTVAHCKTILPLLAERLAVQAEAGEVREPLQEEIVRTAELMNEAIHKLADLGAVTIAA